MEFSSTDSSYPAQSGVTARAGYGDESLMEKHVKCILFHDTTSLIFPKQTDLRQQQTDSSCHFKYGIHA